MRILPIVLCLCILATLLAVSPLRVEVDVQVDADQEPHHAPTEHHEESTSTPSITADSAQATVRNPLKPVSAWSLPYDANLKTIEASSLPIIGASQGGAITLSHSTTTKAFVKWAKAHKKAYLPSQFMMRLKNWYNSYRSSFYHNHDKTRQFNRKTFAWADLTQEEFIAQYAGTRPLETGQANSRRLLQFSWLKNLFGGNQNTNTQTYPTSTACSALGGQCTDNCPSGNTKTGICTGPANDICCLGSPVPTAPVDPVDPTPTQPVGPPAGAADSWDWRQQGNVITPPRNQNQCGACWAFSSTAAIESNYAINNNNLLQLSPQQFIDCTFGVEIPAAEQMYGSGVTEQGCTFGYPQLAMIWGESNPLVLESSYATTGTQGTCQSSGMSTTPVQVTNWNSVTQDVATIEAAVQKGPVVASLTVIDSFSSYSGGIYQDTGCNGQTINHATLMIGYGSDNGVNYWLLKNSWGTAWGEGGYYRILRGSNECSIEANIVAVQTN